MAAAKDQSRSVGREEEKKGSDDDASKKTKNVLGLLRLTSSVWLGEKMVTAV